VVTTDMWKSIDQEMAHRNGWSEGEYTANVGDGHVEQRLMYSERK
jgi:hypothetical protein